MYFRPNLMYILHVMLTSGQRDVMSLACQDVRALVSVNKTIAGILSGTEIPHMFQISGQKNIEDFAKFNTHVFYLNTLKNVADPRVLGYKIFAGVTNVTFLKGRDFKLRRFVNLKNVTFVNLTYWKVSNTLPNSLKTLRFVGAVQSFGLENVPSSVTHLYMKNSFIALHRCPVGLEVVEATVNVQSFNDTTLPKSLKVLRLTLTNCVLDTNKGVIPPLPEGLQVLDIYSTVNIRFQDTVLPKGLLVLKLYGQIIHFPTLPKSLTTLHISGEYLVMDADLKNHTNLTSLTISSVEDFEKEISLPTSITYLDCDYPLSSQMTGVIDVTKLVLLHFGYRGSIQLQFSDPAFTSKHTIFSGPAKANIFYRKVLV